MWSSWGATWRDVQILDANNDRVGIYNLTENSLADEENYATLKQMLLDAAE